MLLALVSRKGGVGKTTAAVHLAGALAEHGRTVLLDGDQNRSATGWTQQGRGLPYPVHPVEDPPDGFAHTVVDSAANETDADLRTLARHAGVVVVPSRPAALDLVGAVATVRLLRDTGTPIHVLLSMCPPRPQRDALEAREFLVDRGVGVLMAEIPARKGYQTAALEGCLVRDSSDRAAGELWAVWPRLLSEVRHGKG